MVQQKYKKIYRIHIAFSITSISRGDLFRLPPLLRSERYAYTFRPCFLARLPV